MQIISSNFLWPKQVKWNIKMFLKKNPVYPQIHSSRPPTNKEHGLLFAKIEITWYLCYTDLVFPILPLSLNC